MVMRPPLTPLRATLVTPPPYGHPLYNQRGSWEDSDNAENTLHSTHYTLITKH